MKRRKFAIVKLACLSIVPLLLRAPKINGPDAEIDDIVVPVPMATSLLSMYRCILPVADINVAAMCTYSSFVTAPGPVSATIPGVEDPHMNALNAPSTVSKFIPNDVPVLPTPNVAI